MKRKTESDLKDAKKMQKESKDDVSFDSLKNLYQELKKLAEDYITDNPEDCKKYNLIGAWRYCSWGQSAKSIHIPAVSDLRKVHLISFAIGHIVRAFSLYTARLLEDTLETETSTKKIIVWYQKMLQVTKKYNMDMTKYLTQTVSNFCSVPHPIHILCVWYTTFNTNGFNSKEYLLFLLTQNAVLAECEYHCNESPITGYLVPRGAFDPSNCHFGVDRYFGGHQDPVTLAILGGHLELVKMFVEDYRVTLDLWLCLTPLVLSMAMGLKDIMEYLMERSNINHRVDNGKDYNGRLQSALDAAIGFLSDFTFPLEKLFEMESLEYDKDDANNLEKLFEKYIPDYKEEDGEANEEVEEEEIKHETRNLTEKESQNIKEGFKCLFNRDINPFLSNSKNRQAKVLYLEAINEYKQTMSRPIMVDCIVQRTQLPSTLAEIIVSYYSSLFTPLPRLVKPALDEEESSELDLGESTRLKLK